MNGLWKKTNIAGRTGQQAISLKICMYIIKANGRRLQNLVNPFSTNIPLKDKPSSHVPLKDKPSSHRPASLLKMSLLHRCFSNIFLVKTGYLVSTQVNHWLKMGQFHGIIFYICPRGQTTSLRQMFLLLISNLYMNITLRYQRVLISTK